MHTHSVREREKEGRIGGVVNLQRVVNVRAVGIS